MEYGKIIAVTGLPGLFELVSSKSNGAIVRSLEDQSTKFVTSRVHNFSHLESIEVYTVRDNINLLDVFIAMKNSTEVAPDGKDAAALKSYFEKIVPELDFERVYSSDLKKMVKWFSIIDKNNIELKRYEETEEVATEAVEVAAEEAPAPKKTAKKAAAKEPKATTEGEEAPAPKKAAKKAAPKAKKAETEGEEAPAPKKAAKKSASKSTKKTDGE